MKNWRRQKKEEAKAEELATKKRREERKLAREKREKDRIKSKMENEIRKYMIEKGGTCVNGIASEMLIDVNGHYERAKPYLGALGG